MKRTSWLGCCCGAMLAGLSASYFHGFSLSIIVVCAGLLVSVKPRYRTGFLLCAASLCIGWWRGGTYLARLHQYQKYQFAKTTITAIATSDGTYTTRQQLSFTASHVSINGKALPGTISVSGFGINGVAAGDTIVAQGKLYPATGGYQARMSYAELAVAAHHPTPMSIIRNRFDAGIYSALPEPAASFALGLLIGQHSNLPAEVKQDLLWVGLTHIIAVSGYNLTILLRAAGRILGKQPRRMGFAISVGIIGFFTLLTGASASIMRAALVSGLGLVAGYYGRAVKPLNIILIAAAATALLKPTYIWGDISWYLSFLAFFGVLVLAPLITQRFRPLRRSILAGIMLESFCAEIMTVPIILLTFGQFSTVALLANMTIALLVPVAMLCSAMAGVAGMTMPLWAGWLAWPAALVLGAMLEMAHVFAALPHAFLQNIVISVSQTITMYIVIAMVCLLLYFKNQRINAKITDRI